MRCVLTLALLFAGCESLKPEAPPVLLPKSVSIDEVDVTPQSSAREAGQVSDPIQLGRFVIFLDQHASGWLKLPADLPPSTFQIVAKSKGEPVAYLELGDTYLLGRLAGEEESAQRYLPISELDHMSLKGICDSARPAHASVKSQAAEPANEESVNDAEQAAPAVEPGAKAASEEPAAAPE